MPAVSLSRRVQSLRRRVAPDRQTVDLGLEVRTPDGRPIITAGGAWEVSQQEYLPCTAALPAVRLVSSQLQAATQLAAWLVAYEQDAPDRQALEQYVDNRRGGKTWFVCLAICIFSLRYPSSHLGKTICWIVVPTYPQQREIHECISHIIPPEWFRDKRIVYHKSDKYYELANGAQIWIKSADRPQSLKAGGVAAIAINEAQQVDAKGILNAMGANIDSGGICWLAMNPPDSVKGLWAENLHDAINALDDNGLPVLPWARETAFPAAQNEVINQRARTRFGKLAEVIDPRQAKRDALGLWVSIRDRAYPKYNRNQHYRAEPTGWPDITADVNGLTYLLNKGDARHYGAGMDFQRRPWCAFVEGKCLRAPVDGPWGPAGTIIYVIRHEVTNDVGSGDWWTEDLLCQKITESADKRGTAPHDYLLIGDGTGHHQGASGAQRGRRSDPATWSWSIVQSYGWEPHAPIEKRSMSRGPGPATMKPSYLNPPVPVRLDVINQLLMTNRLIITPDCPLTAESFRTCETKNRKPWGEGAHLTDAAGYLLYVWETALREAGVVKVCRSLIG